MSRHRRRSAGIGLNISGITRRTEEPFLPLLQFVIAHELQHLKQFASGVKPDGLWNGLPLPLKTLYHEFPWEIDANKVAYELTGYKRPLLTSSKTLTDHLGQYAAAAYHAKHFANPEPKDSPCLTQ